VRKRSAAVTKQPQSMVPRKRALEHGDVVGTNGESAANHCVPHPLRRRHRR
jgi:hypothetical protein